jgi:purine-binding chemotaxis protein CheW
MQPITQVPRAPAFVSGVINLRGKVIPVVDLRLKFGMPQIEETERTCIIVVQMERDNRVQTMGAIVDEVSEVMDIAAASIEPAPELGMGLDTDFILGLAKTESSVTILLDTVMSLSPTEAALVAAMPSAPPVEVVKEAIQTIAEDNGK